MITHGSDDKTNVIRGTPPYLAPEVILRFPIFLLFYHLVLI